MFAGALVAGAHAEGRVLRAVFVPVLRLAGFWKQVVEAQQSQVPPNTHENRS